MEQLQGNLIRTVEESVGLPFFTLYLCVYVQKNKNKTKKIVLPVSPSVTTPNPASAAFYKC